MNFKIIKTRFKIAVSLISFFGLTMLFCLFFKGDSYIDIMSKCIAAIMVIAPAYILGDSYRKSSNPNEG